MRRETKQREAILIVLRNTRSHPTADQIYDEVRKSIPNISKGTVYRNLQVLQEDGDITELNLNGTLGRYEVKQERHYHFRCEKCGRVSDIDMPIHRDLDQEAGQRTGLKISSHQLEFRGLCKECQNESKGGGLMAVKKTGEKYICNVCGNEVIVTKVGGETPVCCGENMERIEG
jgi:Fur family peroxide stress response transcriptional regulator